MNKSLSELLTLGVAKVTASRNKRGETLTADEKAFLDSGANTLTEKLALVEGLMESEKKTPSISVRPAPASKPVPGEVELTRANFLVEHNKIEDPIERAMHWKKNKHLLGY